jgi:hypothetical protein
LPLASKWPELWRNLLTACWRTHPALRPDMATIGGWLYQMQMDFEKNPTADGYSNDPALSSEELQQNVPVVSSQVVTAQNVTTVDIPVTAAVVASVVAPSVNPVVTTVAVTGPTVVSAEETTKKDNSVLVAPSVVVLAPTPGPVVAEQSSSAPPLPKPHSSSSDSRPSSAPPPSAPPSASLPAVVEKAAPVSPSLRHRSAKGGIFDSLARANDVAIGKHSVEMVDARPDEVHSPHPEKK